MVNNRTCAGAGGDAGRAGKKINDMRHAARLPAPAQGQWRNDRHRLAAGLPTVNHLPDIKATGLIARVNTQAQRNLKLPRQLA